MKNNWNCVRIGIIGFDNAVGIDNAVGYQFINIILKFLLHEIYFLGIFNPTFHPKNSLIIYFNIVIKKAIFLQKNPNFRLLALTTIRKYAHRFFLNQFSRRFTPFSEFLHIRLEKSSSLFFFRKKLKHLSHLRFRLEQSFPRSSFAKPCVFRRCLINGEIDPLVCSTSSQSLQVALRTFADFAQ